MRRSFFPLSCLAILALSSCFSGTIVYSSSSSSQSSSGSSSASSSVSSSSSSSSSNSSVTSISSQTDEKPKIVSTAEFYRLFSGENIEIKLTFSEESLAAICSYQSERHEKKYHDVYFPADFVLKMGEDEYVYEEVGVRMKGNTSRRDILSDGVIVQPCHFKVSFAETFDDPVYEDSAISSFKKEWASSAERLARDERRLFDLKKLDLKYVPRNEGTCYEREVYAFSCFREAGLLAPYAGLATVTLDNGNGEAKYGYELIEPIDKTFLQRRYNKENAKGDLYKCVYNDMGKADLARSGAINSSTGERIANGKIGVEDNYNGYVPCYQLKTNDKLGEGSDFSKMANYIVKVHDLVYDGASKDVLESLLDVDEFLRFSALSYLLGGFDDQRYNNNNYYLYFHPATGKVIYIPYDWDWCLGTDCGHGLSSWGPFYDRTIDGGEQCSIYYATFLKSKKSYSNIKLDRTEYQNKYMSYVSSYLDLALGGAEGFSEDWERESVSQYMVEKRSVALGD